MSYLDDMIYELEKEIEEERAKMKVLEEELEEAKADCEIALYECLKVMQKDKSVIPGVHDRGKV